MFKKAVVTVSVLVGVLGFCCLGYGADLDKGLSFYLSFDNSLDAKVSGGIETPQKAIQIEYEEGVKGKGAVINGMDRLIYKAKKGYFSFEEGTISMWVKPNYDDDAFRGEIDKDRKAKGWYFSQGFVSIYESKVNKLGLGLSHSNRRKSAANLYTYPTVQHFKFGSVSFEKGKWINFLYTWNALDENIEFYINGERAETQIHGREDFWDMPEEIDYSLCRITIC